MNIKYDVMVDAPQAPVPPVAPGDGRDRSDVRVCPLKSADCYVDDGGNATKLGSAADCRQSELFNDGYHLTQKSFCGLSYITFFCPLCFFSPHTSAYST